VFENRVLRRIFGHKRKKVPGGWREACDELHNLCSLPNIILYDQIKEDEMGGECSMHGREEKWVQSFDGKPEGKRSL
jgi:hypothetical protein